MNGIKNFIFLKLGSKNLKITIFSFFFFSTHFAMSAMTAANKAEMYETLKIKKGERLLIVAPHPDDETLGPAGLVQKVLKKGGQVQSIVVTAGDSYVSAIRDYFKKLDLDPNDYIRYGQLRLAESKSAAQLLSGSQIRLKTLGFSDGSVYDLLLGNWNSQTPFRSGFSFADHIPYKESDDYGQPQAGEILMNRLINTLKTFKPTMITFTDPMEEDSDHAGVGLFTLTAVDKWIKNSIILENEKSNLNSRAVTKNQISAPRLFAYLIHWHHWPLQDIPDQPVDISHAPLIFPKEFPKRDLKRVCIPLQKNERELKRNVLMKYKTQQQAMGGYLSMFINSTECFSQIELNDFSDIQSTVELWQKSPENPEIVPLKLCNKKPCPAYQLR